MTRRAWVCGLVLTFSLWASSLATAAPTAKFKAEFVPIAGFPHTGNILGAGAALRTEYRIEGTEYGGFPAPLVGVNLYFPQRTLPHPAGFATCAKTTLEQEGPSGCPVASTAGPVGNELGIVSFGSERVEESTTLESFYSPEGGLEFFAAGHSPVSLEILSAGLYANLAGGGGFGPELTIEVPLVSTVPGKPFASIEGISVKFGTARKVQGKPVYYARVPNRCQKGGFPIKTEVIFDKEGAIPPIPEPVTASYKAPCPKTRVVQTEPAPESAPQLAPIPVPEPPPTPLPGTDGAITAPSNAKCVSRRDFVVHVQHIKGLSYRHVEVVLNGHAVTVLTGKRSHARVDLRGLPKGRYTLQITVLTTNGRTLRGTRAYHTCEPKPRPFKKPPL